MVTKNLAQFIVKKVSSDLLNSGEIALAADERAARNSLDKKVAAHIYEVLRGPCIYFWLVSKPKGCRQVGF